MEKFKPSEYQQDIFDFIKNGKGSAVIDAVAGSGKSTTLCEAVKLLPSSKKILFCAFNKAIVTELSERLPDYVNVKTLNGLGHGAWIRFTDAKLNLNTRKTLDIIRSESFIEQFGEWPVKRLGSKVRKLVAIAKAVGIVPEGADEDADNGLSPDTLEVWDQLIDHFDIDFMQKNKENISDKKLKELEKLDKETAIEMTREALRRGLENWNTIDFDDQLYLPVVYDVPCYRNDIIFVDEAQDISHIQRILLKKNLKSNGRLIAVGDEKQAIYGFRSADHESLNNMVKEFKAIRLPLSISYRCPKLVVKEAQKFSSAIESHKNAPDGTVEHWGVLTNKELKEFKLNDYIICRNTAPLIRLAFDLIRVKKPVTVIGRDIGKNLINLIQKLNANSLEHLIDKLELWRDREVKKLIDKDPDANISRIEEKQECIKVFMDSSGASTVSDLIQAIDEMFGDVSDIRHVVVLSTIHKSKGLEFDRVFILDSWLIPSKYAKKGWQLTQEDNIFYVGITRSKNFLAYIKSPKRNKI